MKKKESIEYWSAMAKFISGEMTEEEQIKFKVFANKNDEMKLLNQVESDMKKIDIIKEDYKEKVDNAWAKLHDRLEKEDLIPNETKVRKIGFAAFSKIAAVLILAFGLTYAGMQLINTGRFAKNMVALTESQQKKITLADGTEVYLNGNSKLTYPKNFSQNERRVQLKGEAFFNVTKNPEQPFVIEACDAEIKVLGTSFNVLTEFKTKNVEVLVESGLVRLSNKGNAEKGILLEKGEFGILENANPQKSINKDENYLSWRTKQLVFRETSINEVIEVLNHTYAKNIRLDFEDASALKLNSTYDNVELDTILESICIAFDLKLTEKSDEIVLATSKK